MQKYIINKRSKGFSLPEVAMSLGIASVSLITLVSLLPFGLDTLRDSSNRQAEARIVQSVSGLYQMSDWLQQKEDGDREMVINDRTLFYDQSGNELANAKDINCSYVVEVHVAPAPTVKGDNQSNQYLRQLRIRITDRPLDYQNALKKDSGLYSERNTWIALLEQTGFISSL